MLIHIPPTRFAESVALIPGLNTRIRHRIEVDTGPGLLAYINNMP